MFRGIRRKLINLLDDEPKKAVYNIDDFPEIPVEEIVYEKPSSDEPQVFYRREAEERVRVTLTMKKSTFNDLLTFCDKTQTSMSRALRAGHNFSKQPFLKEPKLIKSFDE